jgi:hypothetical protein
MTDEPDPLEAELAALRPREPSPELPLRIGERLARPASPKTWRWAIASIGLTLAIAAAIVFWPRPPAIVEPEPPVDLPSSIFDESLPTVWAYRHALSESPQALDAMLDEQSLRTLPAGAEPALVHPFAIFDSAPSLGE